MYTWSKECASLGPIVADEGCDSIVYQQTTIPRTQFQLQPGSGLAQSTSTHVTTEAAFILPVSTGFTIPRILKVSIADLFCYDDVMQVLVNNKKAGFNYELLDRYQAGIELLGFEVKSLRAGHASLDASYIYVQNGQAYIKGMHISPYQQGNTPESYDPDRDRRILLTKSEIKTLSELARGLTIVPILVYNTGRKIKVELATAKGKKKFDKRETLKKKTTERDIRREFSDR